MFSHKSISCFLFMFLLLALILLPASPVRANPGTLYAAPDAQGSGDCSSWGNACTLQTALASAVSGDEIWVKAGAHYPGAAGDRLAAFTLMSGVALYGGFAGTETSRDQRDWQVNQTILSGDIDQNDINTDGNHIAETWNDIQGDNAYHVAISGGTDSSAILDGFIITAGQANEPVNWSTYLGGGMYTENSNLTLANIVFSGNFAIFGGGINNENSSLVLTNVTFRGNSANRSGGGMYNWSSSLTLTNVTFSNNYSDYRGGGVVNNNSSPMLTNVIFSGNSAPNLGGAMLNVYGSNPTLVNVTFSGNSAEAGGGMCNWDSSPVLTNVTFSGNSASWGGGIYNMGDSGPVLTNVTFSGNSAEAGGGGMFNNNSSPVLTNITFLSNSADADGGGMCNWNNSSPMLTNVTFNGNTADRGGGMVNLYLSRPTLKNVVLWGNSAITSSEIYNDDSAPIIAYSDIQGCGGSDSGWNSACGTDGGGNIDADPLFVDAAGGDLRLQAGSPAIDAGIDDAIPSGVLTDLAGNPRIMGAAVDMGAYESQDPTTYHRLLVSLIGEDWGRVQSDPAGIACPGDCGHGYLPGTTVVLTATPVGPTATLVGWEGCDSIVSNTCTLTMTSIRSVKVVFSHASRALYAAPEAQGNGDCSSWGNACTLQTALASAVSGDEIWVKAGVHYPGAAGNRLAAFTLRNDVALYGGFAGTETSRSQRNWQTNVTILSGDIDQNDINTDGNHIAETWNDIQGGNAYHVVISSRTDSSAILDGFIITAGQGEDENWTWPNFAGGGVFNQLGSPTLTNIIVSGNTAVYGGGMLNRLNSNPRLTNVVFRGNISGFGGGMLNNANSSPTLTNVTFSGNFAGEGGAIANWDNSGPMLTNVILWGNSADAGPEIYNDNDTPVIAYSDIQGCGGSGSGWNSACGTDGGGNIDADPLFVDAAGGDLRLQAGSPAINAGNNAAIPSGVLTDLAGNPRIMGAAVDMGAYELDTSAPSVVSITRANPNPTSAASVDFTVTFSEAVTGVDAADFALTPTGSISGAGVTGVTGSGSTYTVTVNTGAGNGTLRLDLNPSGTGIEDLAGNPIAGGFTGGQVYSVRTQTFNDVPVNYWSWQFIERLYNAGITTGCSSAPMLYCPGQTVTRDQMAVFLLRSIHGAGYMPPAVGGSTGFADVPVTHWAAAWIKQLAAEGITTGCGSGNYCPSDPVTRDQMAVFLLRAKYGAAYNPPAVGGSTGFADVPVTYWAAAWIKQLAAEGITTGCSPTTYCPSDPVTRDQMAVFLVRTFNLP